MAEYVATSKGSNQPLVHGATLHLSECACMRRGNWNSRKAGTGTGTETGKDRRQNKWYSIIVQSYRYRWTIQGINDIVLVD